MSDDTSVHPPSRLAGLGEHWGLVLGYGIVSLGLGVVLAVWPGETLVVCAVIIAIQLVAGGVFRIVTALVSVSHGSGPRALLGFTGGVSLVIGMLCLLDPVQTLRTIVYLVGAWWLVSGVVDVLAAVVAPAQGRRAWDIVSGVVGIAVGAFLLVNPERSLGLLVVVTCVWLFAVGTMAVVAGLGLRADRARVAAAAEA